MLLTIKDANGDNRNIIANSQAAPTDLSGTIAAANVSQVLAPENLDRSGFYFQNLSEQGILINELGNDATGAGSFMVEPLGVFPPCGYPVPTGAITIAGPAVGAAFAAREW
jgi:hypothetical protein